MASQNRSLVPNPFPPDDWSQTHAMVTRLCQESGFADQISIVKIRRGGRHTIIQFTCVLEVPLAEVSHDPRTTCVLRTSIQKYPTPQFHDLEVQTMVAFYVCVNPEIRATRPLAYDSTYDNHIQCSYMIQTWEEGLDLQEHYRRLQVISDPDYEDGGPFGINIAENIMEQETMLSFHRYGTFQCGNDMALKSTNPNKVSDHISLQIIPFSRNFHQMQTNSTAIDFITDVLNHQEGNQRDELEETRYRKLVDIALSIKVLQDPSHPAHKAEPSVPWHPNYHPRKIMVTMQTVVYEDSPFVPIDLNSIKAVIGWEGVLALPRIMTRCPPSFLWQNQLTPAEAGACIKEWFDEKIEEMLPGYCEDAYGEQAKIVGALGMYAVNGVNFQWAELSFEELMDAWEKYVTAGNEE